MTSSLTLRSTHRVASNAADAPRLQTTSLALAKSLTRPTLLGITMVFHARSHLQMTAALARSSSCADLDLHVKPLRHLLVDDERYGDAWDYLHVVWHDAIEQRAYALVSHRAHEAVHHAVVLHRLAPLRMQLLGAIPA